MDLLTRLDLRRIGRNYLLARSTKLDPSIVDTLGSDADIFIGSQSFVADAQTRQTAAGIASLLYGSARGDDLDRLVLDRNGGVGNEAAARKGAAAALVDLRFSRATVAAGSGSLPIGTRVATDTGVEYVVTETVAFGASTLVVEPVIARAVSAGKAFQVGANNLRNIRGPKFDSTIQVTNPLAAAGGEDREGDGEYVGRARDFWRTQRRGILAAIELGARSVPGIASAQAVEELTPLAQPARVVRLYIADSSGVASRPLGAAVVRAVTEWRAAGIAVVPYLSTPQLVAVRLSLSFLAGTESVSLAEEVRAAVFGFANSLPVNGPLLRADLLAVLRHFVPRGLVLAGSTVLDPAGDLVPAPGQTLRVRFEDVTLA